MLRCGEYRESADIDFLVSDIDGYRELRRRLTGPEGINSVTVSPVRSVRSIRADQYGIRTILEADGTPIKFEVVHEGRIALQSPSAAESILGVSTLSAVDTVATKLLANADRWNDPGVHHRDLMDLAMLAPAPGLLADATKKASVAYGSSITRCLTSAVDAIDAHPERLLHSMAALQVNVPYDELRTQIAALRPA